MWSPLLSNGSPSFFYWALLCFLLGSPSFSNGPPSFVHCISFIGELTRYIQAGLQSALSVSPITLHGRRIQRVRAGTAVALRPKALEAFWNCLLSACVGSIFGSSLFQYVGQARLSVCPSVRPSICQSVSLSVSVSVPLTLAPVEFSKKGPLSSKCEEFSTIC